MRKILLAVLACMWIASGQVAAQSFSLDFDVVQTDGGDAVGDTIEGDAGTAVAVTANLTLTSDGLGAEGPQGWSLGASVEGLDILEATTAGTVAAPEADGGLMNTGFDQTQVIDPARNDGKQGLVSAVVLSFIMPITLPPNQTDTVLIATYSGAIGDADSTAKWQFDDGLVGQGQPVVNNVTLEGVSFKPQLGSREIELKVAVDPEVCDDGVDNDGDGDTDCADADCADFGACTEAGNCDDGIDNDGDGQTDCDDVDDCPDGVAPCVDGPGFRLALTADAAVDGILEILADDGAQFQVFAVIGSSDPEASPEEGAQGWSMSIEHDPAVLGVAGVTTDNTFAADVGDGGIRSGGFEKTEAIDPANNKGRGGVVTAIVLSFTQPISLDVSDGDKPVLDLTYEVQAGAGSPDLDTRIDYTDGLRGSGQPVDTVLTVAGATELAQITEGLQIKAGEAPTEEAFVRGDANDDGKVNIADPIWVINELFRDGPMTSCPDAADATDDGSIDLADAMFLIEYRFLAGALPAAPFPECGTDPTADDVECGPDSFSSCP